MPTFTQTIKLTFGRHRFGAKDQCTIYRPEYIFSKSHVIKLIEPLTNFIYQNDPQCKFSNSYHVKKFVNNT